LFKPDWMIINYTLSLKRLQMGLIAAFGLLFWRSYASAHLVTTGLGPVYDCIGHLVKQSGMGSGHAKYPGIL